jgi:hypothetical protein
MNGTITFDELKDLAKFLKEFTGSTAIFETKQCQTTKRWVLTFLGGY